MIATGSVGDTLERQVSLRVEQCLEHHWGLYLEYDDRIDEHYDQREQSSGAERDGGAVNQSGDRAIGSLKTR